MLFVDSDVLLDAALERDSHYVPSLQFLQSLREGAEKACTSWHAVANVHYFARAGGRERFARAYIEDMISFIDIVPTGTDDIRYALSLPMSDFEDAMQVAAAITAGARLIVTRNLDDYAQSPIRVISPAEAVAELS